MTSPALVRILSAVALLVGAAGTARASSLADTNCDGHVDFLDINPFVYAVTDPERYVREFPHCSLCTADINRDGTVDFLDINPFVDCIADGGCAEEYTCPPTGACCYANGLCLELVRSDCESDGAVYQGDDTQCTPELCPVPTGACCYPNDSCAELDEAGCYNEGGTYRGDYLACKPNPCALPVGACCYPNGSCVETDAQTCAFEGAVYQGDGTSCAATSCPLPVGACCYPNGSCVDTDQSTCENEGAQYQGDGTACGPDICPVFGACCYPNGSCIEADPATCAFEGAAYQGDGTDCATTYCPPPVGACCYPNGSCVETDEDTCANEGARYWGDGSSCEPNPCPPPIGACCYPNGSCVETDRSTCENEGAEYRGDGSECETTDCSRPTGACCFPGGTCVETDEFACLFFEGDYLGDGSACEPNPCPICEVEPAPPNALGTGTAQPGRLRLDILMRNVVRGGSGALFPAVPDARLRQDGVRPADFAVVRRGIDAADGWDLRGRIYYPATIGGQDQPVAPGGPFPVVLIAHGRHNSLRLPHGPDVIVNDENYRGYIYLQEHLARNGFISISIDLDDVVNVAKPTILSRAWLVLCHLRNLEEINGTVGHRLRNQLDLTRIALLGHSRGGEVVVQAARMNTDGTGPYGTLQADPANRRLFDIRAVFALAATRFYDGTKNYDDVAAGREPAAPESRVATPGRTPFLGMWGDADGDVTGASGFNLPPSAVPAGPALEFPGLPAGRVYTNTPDVIALHVEGIYDRSDADPKQFVWIEGANHNFWNTSWYDLTRPRGERGDDGERDLGAGVVNLVPLRITDVEQEELLMAYGLAFVRGYLLADATALQFRRYFRGPANELPAAPIARNRAHLRYQDIPPSREIVDSFEDATFDLDRTSRGVGGIDRTTVTVAELRLQRAEAPSTIDTRPPLPFTIGDTYADRSWFHNTVGALIRWAAMNNFYETVCPPGGAAGADVRAFDVLSFRIALDIRGPGAAPALEVDVRIEDGAGRSATVRTSAITTIPQAQDRRESIFPNSPAFPATRFLTKSMLKTACPCAAFVRTTAPWICRTSVAFVSRSLIERRAGSASTMSNSAASRIQRSRAHVVACETRSALATHGCAASVRPAPRFSQ